MNLTDDERKQIMALAGVWFPRAQTIAINTQTHVLTINVEGEGDAWRQAQVNQRKALESVLQGIQVKLIIHPSEF